MIFLYSLVLVALGAVKFIVQRRAAALGRAYAQAALAVQNRLRETQFKPGNGSMPDACQLAKVQYELGWIVAKRDRIEGKHFTWQLWAEMLSRWVNNLSNWKGKKLPYTLGAVDIWLALSAVDALGVADVLSARRVCALVASMLTPKWARRKTWLPGPAGREAFPSPLFDRGPRGRPPKTAPACAVR